MGIVKPTVFQYCLLYFGKRYSQSFGRGGEWRFFSSSYFACIYYLQNLIRLCVMKESL